MRYRGIKFRRKPKICSLIPWFSSFTAQAFCSSIFVSKEILDNLKSGNPDPHFLAVLEHEKKHLERQEELGFLRFGVKYLLFPKFRLQEELIAEKASMDFLKKKGLAYDLRTRAKYLSSWLYLWMVSLKEARRKLKELWLEA